MAESEVPAKASVTDRLYAWGSSGIPPSTLATLNIALHARPRQPLPLFLFTPPLFLATWFNLSGQPTAAAGLTAAWSGLYVLLTLRRRQPGGVSARFFSPRGLTRGAALGLAAVNCAAGGWRYFNGDYEKDEEERIDRNRWGSE